MLFLRVGLKRIALRPLSLSSAKNGLYQIMIIILLVYDLMMVSMFFGYRYEKRSYKVDSNDFTKSILPNYKGSIENRDPSVLSSANNFLPDLNIPYASTPSNKSSLRSTEYSQTSAKSKLNILQGIYICLC